MSPAWEDRGPNKVSLSHAYVVEVLYRSRDDDGRQQLREHDHG